MTELNEIEQNQTICTIAGAMVAASQFPGVEVKASESEPWTYDVRLYWLLRTSVQKQAYRDGERSPSPACRYRRVGVESDVVTSMLMLDQRQSHVMENFLVWLVFCPISSS